MFSEVISKLKVFKKLRTKWRHRFFLTHFFCIFATYHTKWQPPKNSLINKFFGGKTCHISKYLIQKYHPHWFSKHWPSEPMLSIRWNVRPCVCLSVCFSLCSLLKYRLTVFLAPLPKVVDLESLGTRNGKKWSHIWTILLKNCLNVFLTAKKNLLFFLFFWLPPLFFFAPYPLKKNSMKRDIKQTDTQTHGHRDY